MKTNNRGQALIEYVLIIMLITSVTAVAVLFLGNAIKDSLTKTACNITGGTYQPGTSNGKGTCDNKLELYE